MMTCDQLAETIGKLKKLLAENGRADDPFEYQAVCIDKFGVDGHRELAEAGVTDNIVIPWVFDGLGFDAPMRRRRIRSSGSPTPTSTRAGRTDRHRSRRAGSPRG